MLRSAGAVVAGYLVFAISAIGLFAITGREAHAAQETAFMVLATLWGMAFAGLGGWIAARLAGGHPTRHGAAVALVIVVLAAVSIPSVEVGVFPWTQVAAIVAMAPCALLGGRLARPRP